MAEQGVYDLWSGKPLDDTKPSGNTPLENLLQRFRDHGVLGFPFVADILREHLGRWGFDQWSPESCARIRGEVLRRASSSLSENRTCVDRRLLGLYNPHADVGSRGDRHKVEGAKVSFLADLLRNGFEDHGIPNELTSYRQAYYAAVLVVCLCEILPASAHGSETARPGLALVPRPPSTFPGRRQ